MRLLTYINSINDWLAEKITNSVSTMWCAWIFTIIAVCGLPAALAPGGIGIFMWLSSMFIQLVMLAVISFAQKITSEKESAKLSAQSVEQHQELLDILTTQKEEIADLREILRILHQGGKANGEEETD